MTNENYLGVDLGSVSLVVVVIDGYERVLWRAYRRVQGRSRDRMAAICKELLTEWMWPNSVTTFKGALATGSGKEVARDLLGIGTVNEIVAHGTVASGLVRGRASVIEIGGQDSKFILVDENGAFDYSMNELCAAGTGAFLDVQAERLGLSIEELSVMAANAKSIPHMAGRCSVFAKSDIIHLQQRGVPVDQIVAGLCYSLARNYVATLIRGRTLIKPMVFQGGVALNEGVLRAFKDVLKLSNADVVRPDMPHMAGALGAAMLARKDGSGPALDAAVIAQASDNRADGIHAARFPSRLRAMDAASQMFQLESFEKTGGVGHGENVFIGLDVGSISTKAVVLDGNGTLLTEIYLLTSGEPLMATHRIMGFLAEVVSAGEIAAVGITGSGRKLVGHAICADLVIDEITAQARGAKYGCEEADTVIEIGGQDAKFIKVGEDGSVLDFEMNKVCSAGTGSFIQEQALRLGVDLKSEYSKLAMRSGMPLLLTSRCTVFMESDLVHHIQQGVPLPDLLMGVSRAVVENYLSRVAQGRRCGAHVVFQGGVAKNQSVVAALKKRLKDLRVIVHPHPGVSGAIGVALLALERFHAASAGAPILSRSFLKGLDFSTSYRTSSFTCKGCENGCEITVFHFTEGSFHFGDLCGRYSEAVSGIETGQDLTEDMSGLLAERDNASSSGVCVGVPRALLFSEYYPFWKQFFAELSIPIKVSGPSSSEILSLAHSRLPAEICLPVKLLFGHVAALQQEGVTTVFIPSCAKNLDGLNCPYVQYGAAMIHATFETIKVLTMPLVPDFSEKERLLLMASETFGRDIKDVLLAFEAATAALERFRKSSASKAFFGRSGKRPLAVLLGKPYNIHDRFVNMSLTSKLARAGFDVVTYEQTGTPVDQPLPDRYDSIAWTFSRRMLRTAFHISVLDDVFPIVIGNFGCGPDSFTFPLLQEIFGSRPSLFLEFDEHRADAGLATRVEAFAHRVAAWRNREKRDAGNSRQETAGGHVDYRSIFCLASHQDEPEYIIPFFSDHAYAFAGALASKGIKARVLPLPDHNSYEAGVTLSGGKQCHPFQLIAGDLVNLALSGDLPKGAIYLVPSTQTSCLITQYVPTIQMYMDTLNRSDVRVMGTNSVELLERLGALFVFDMGKALLGIEYLSRLRFEMRPYEIEKNSVDKAYARALEILYQRHVANRINKGIMEAAQTLAAVPTRNRGSKPVIAITGDAYTRVNPAANCGLFSLLESLGCEVWPSPTMVDIVMTGQEIQTRQYWETGRPLDMLSSWGMALVNNLGANRVIKNFKGLLTNLTEPHADDVLKYTHGLLPGEPELLVTLNVAKHVDFANKGVDGILNVYCLNCLVGTATTSIFKGLIERTAGVPMMPLVFEAMGNTHIRNRVEAFVHRVKRNRQEKLARTAAENLAFPVVATGYLAGLKELLERKLFDVSIPDMKFQDLKMLDIRLPTIRMPRLKRPNIWLPEGCGDRTRKKVQDEESRDI